MLSSKPKVVFALADPNWDRWLPPFLEHESFVTQVHWLEASPSWTLDARHGGASLLVPFSRHDTLLSTARQVAELRAASDVEVIHASQALAELALDKARMGRLAQRVPGCRPIEELEIADAEARLAKGTMPAIVLKANDSTEGRGMCVFQTVHELRTRLAARPAEARHVLQPFIQGSEYSINVVRRGGKCLAYEPVHKGPTSLGGVHPCRRLRRCPCTRLTEKDRQRLIQVAVAYVHEAGVEGLAEIELILAGDDIYLLEINPRLSATMRMASLACNRAIFCDVPLASLQADWPGEPPRPVRHTAELPLQRAADLEPLHRLPFPLWFSSRVTVAADDRDTLDERLRIVARLLDLSSLLEAADREVS